MESPLLFNSLMYCRRNCLALCLMGSTLASHCICNLSTVALTLPVSGGNTHCWTSGNLLSKSRSVVPDTFTAASLHTTECTHVVSPLLCLYEGNQQISGVLRCSWGSVDWWNPPMILLCSEEADLWKEQTIYNAIVNNFWSEFDKLLIYLKENELLERPCLIQPS